MVTCPYYSHKGVADGQNWPKLAKNAVFDSFLGHPGFFFEAREL